MKTKLLILLAITICINTKAQTISTVAGNGTWGYSGDGGQATASQLYSPYAVAFDAVGNMYIADYTNNCIRIIGTTGIINTLAGNGSQGYTGDGGQATAATLNSPRGVTCDNAGNLYISDTYNHVIRKVNSSGIITTIAGNGFGAGTSSGGFSGDSGAATDAELNTPWGIALDAAGNLFIADEVNNRIRMVNTVGIINTIAGYTIAAGYSGDGGQATSAKLYQPSGITFDAVGNLYIADTQNNCIRKVDTSGIISTYFIGTLHNPTSVAIDAANNLYIVDNGDNRIIKSGVSIVGDGVSAYNGDGIQANTAEINKPMGLALDAMGNLYIADTQNERIRKVACTAPTLTLASNTYTICNGATKTFTINGASTYTWSPSSSLNNPNSANPIASPTTTTIYSIIGVNSNGCINILSPKTVTLTVNALPSITATSNTISLCVGNTATLQASGAITYTWSTSATSPTIAISPTVTTTYSVTGKDINGCINTDTITQAVTNCTTTGINNLKSNNEIKVYPNPSTGSVQVSFSDNIDELKVRDMLRQIVYEAKPNSTNTTLQLNNVGVYFIIITSGTISKTKKIIITQ